MSEGSWQVEWQPHTAQGCFHLEAAEFMFIMMIEYSWWQKLGAVYGEKHELSLADNPPLWGMRGYGIWFS